MYVRSEACYFSEMLRLYYFIVVFSLSHNVDIRKEKKLIYLQNSYTDHIVFVNDRHGDDDDLNICSINYVTFSSLLAALSCLIVILKCHC